MVVLMGSFLMVQQNGHFGKLFFIVKQNGIFFGGGGNRDFSSKIKKSMTSRKKKKYPEANEKKYTSLINFVPPLLKIFPQKENAEKKKENVKK